MTNLADANKLRPIKVKGGVIDQAKDALKLCDAASLRQLVTLFLQVFSENPSAVYAYLISQRSPNSVSITAPMAAAPVPAPASTDQSDPLADLIGNL